MRKSLMMGTSVLMAVAGVSAASAQDDTIIVTATKREQTLQEVPVAVSVVDDQVVADAQINDVLDLQSVVPSLRVSQLERANNTTFIIRGLGNGGNNPGVEPSVAVYIDGVFRSRSASALADFLDLERVEVLRGPQSTLFGKNATAGVVNIVTKEPSFTTSGVLEGTVGNYNQFIARGYVTGPISETIAYSLSGSYNVRDGYTNNVTNGEDINDRNRQSIRGQLLFQPTDNLELKLIGDWDQIDEICCTVFNAAEVPLNYVSGPTASDVITGLLGGQKQAPGSWDYDVFFDTASANEIINNGVSLQLDYDLGNDITFTSITALRTKEEDIAFEGDFTSLEILGSNSRNLDTETFTQEFRLAGETDRFSWLLGGFYFDESAENDIVVNYGADTRNYVDILSADASLGGSGVSFIEQTVLGLPAGTFFAPETGISTFAVQDNQQLSIFGQVDINVTDRLVLTLGASYYKDEKDVEISSVNTNPFSSLDFVTIGAGVVGQQAFAMAFFDNTGLEATPTNIAFIEGLMPGTTAAIQAGVDAFLATQDFTDPADNPLLGLTALQVLQPSTDFPNSVEDGSSSDEDVPFTVRLAYDVNDRTNVYASYATGFKASSWNLTQDSRPFPGDISALAGAGLLPMNTAVATGTYAGTRFAGPEETESIEVGMKMAFDRGSLNVAVFDQNVDGFQSVTFQGAGFVLNNAGSLSVRGAEFEANYSPIDDLDVSWSGTFLDTEYDSFPGAPVPVGSPADLADGSADGVGDLSGKSIAGVSDFSSSLGVKYTRPTSFGETFIRADWQYESDVQVTDNVSEDILSREVNTINASLGANWENGVEVLLWGRNLFNDEYFTSGFPTTLQAGSFSAYPNAPRTYGVTLRKRY